ncbi:MAG: polyphosphate polymerase domain-containing protein [Sporichthyaceae bacterium]|nr:polyphosphate polymerase domain-containing protein [Sporichthyaceae bacterium]
MGPVSLAEVTANADLQTRVDRKYLLPPEAVPVLAGALGDRALALEIDGARVFSYQSVYFDTPVRTSYLAAAHGRRRRFKVRTRTYADSGDCVLEVKTTGGRGQTIKVRRPYDPALRDVLTAEALAFVDDALGAPDLARTLEPVLTTAYWRATVLGVDLGFRLTADTDLVCSSPGGASVLMDGQVVVETKSWSAPTRPDRVLWWMGHRPVRISKYCVGMAALHPELPANRWHRALRHHLQVR